MGGKSRPYGMDDTRSKGEGSAKGVSERCEGCAKGVSERGDVPREGPGVGWEDDGEPVAVVKVAAYLEDSRFLLPISTQIQNRATMTANSNTVSKNAQQISPNTTSSDNRSLRVLLLPKTDAVLDSKGPDIDVD